MFVGLNNKKANLSELFEEALKLHTTEAGILIEGVQPIKLKEKSVLNITNLDG